MGVMEEERGQCADHRGGEEERMGAAGEEERMGAAREGGWATMVAQAHKRGVGSRLQRLSVRTSGSCRL